MLKMLGVALLLAAVPAAAASWQVFEDEAAWRAATQNVATVRPRVTDVNGASRIVGGYDFHSFASVVTTLDPPLPTGPYLSNGQGGGAAFGAYPARYAPTAIGLRFIGLGYEGPVQPADGIVYTIFATASGPEITHSFSGGPEGLRFIGVVLDGGSSVNFLSIGARRPGDPPGIENAIATLVGGILIGGTALAVPEPGSWAMMIAGFGLIGAAQRRRGRAGATGPA